MPGNRNELYAALRGARFGFCTLIQHAIGSDTKDAKGRDRPQEWLGRTTPQKSASSAVGRRLSEMAKRRRFGAAAFVSCGWRGL